ncbi:MAG: YceI family protein [Chloroflexi bacterium]|nr:YceI family protein [Chloroflexota bacterium]
MRGFLSSFGQGRARTASAGTDHTVPSRGPVSGRAGRAVLATAIAASLLLPFAASGPTVAAAATGPGLAESTARPAQLAEGMTRLALIPGENEARYIMTITTLGQPPKQAACTTRAVTGEIVLAADGSVVQELSKISLDQRTLKCAAPLRDAQAQNLLQTKDFPMAEFIIQSAPGLPAPLPTGDTAFQLIGNQSVKGQVRPTAYDTVANLTPEGMIGTARTTLKMSQFGITPPSIGPLLQVSDDMIAEVDLKTTIASAVAGAPAADPSAADPSAADPSAAPAP